MADYMPIKDSEKAPWFSNLAAKLPTYATVLGFSTADQNKLISAVNGAHDAVELKQSKWNEYLSEISGAQSTIDAAVALVRSSVRRIKANANYSATIGTDLGIVGSSSSVDPASIQPALSADVQPGEVVLKFTKNGASSVNVYSRRVGQPEWKFVSRAAMSPFQDSSPLTAPGVPEQREYCARGLIADTEVGQLSDAVTIVFAG